MAKKATVQVQGEEVVIDHEEGTVADLDLDMDNVASQMSYYGDLWSQAEEEAIQADAHYRAWRAEYGEKLLNSDPKLAEWKVKQKVEASPKFLAIKERLAKAKRNVTILRAHFDALNKKASILQSKGAMRRAELDATSMHTRSESRGARSELEAEARRTREEKARETFKRKKAR
jgi:hypothetical protein